MMKKLAGMLDIRYLSSIKKAGWAREWSPPQEHIRHTKKMEEERKKILVEN
jgi:hypothetical protein